jgi:hypothetical protein
MPRRRTPPPDVIVVGRPRLQLRDEERESIADALADALVELTEKAAPLASSPRGNVVASGSRGAR